jgi:hypothetical protein
MERCRIDSQTKSSYDDAAHDMRTQDLIYIGFRAILVPNALGVYHHNRPVIAYVEAARVVDADAAYSHYYRSATHIVTQFPASPTGTAGTPMGLRPLVRAAEYMDTIERLAFAAASLRVGHASGPGVSRRDAALDSKMLFAT